MSNAAAGLAEVKWHAKKLDFARADRCGDFCGGRHGSFTDTSDAACGRREWFRGRVPGRKPRYNALDAHAEATVGHAAVFS